MNETPTLEKAIANAPPPRDEDGEIMTEVKDQFVKLQVEVEEFKRGSRRRLNVSAKRWKIWQGTMDPPLNPHHTFKARQAKWCTKT